MRSTGWSAACRRALVFQWHQCVFCFTEGFQDSQTIVFCNRIVVWLQPRCTCMLICTCFCIQSVVPNLNYPSGFHTLNLMWPGRSFMTTETRSDHGVGMRNIRFAFAVGKRIRYLCAIIISAGGNVKDRRL